MFLHGQALREERQAEFDARKQEIRAIDQRFARLVRDARGAVREHGPGPGLEAVLAGAGFGEWQVEKRAAQLRLAHLAALEALDYRPKSTPKRMRLRVPTRALERLERAHEAGIPIWPEEDGRLRRVTTGLGTLRGVERWCVRTCSDRWAVRKAFAVHQGQWQHVIEVFCLSDDDFCLARLTWG
jgi:hypothetical protein